MEQDIRGMGEINDLPHDLPNDIEEPGSAEFAADLVREQATGPVPLGPATPGQGEDAVLLVETASLPEQPDVLTPEGLFLGEMGMDEGSPWYRSRWMYIGLGVAGGAALAAGTVLLLRKRSAPQQRINLAGARHMLGQWSGQLSSQTGKLAKQIRRTAPQKKVLVVPVNTLTDQASALTGQAQKQFSRFTRRSPGERLNPMARRRKLNANKWVKQTQKQLVGFSQQASKQLNTVRSSIGSSVGATTAQALGKTQEGLSQVRQGVAVGAAKTGAGVKSGWKFSRNFTLGATAGGLWAIAFTPESGEATRQRLNTVWARVSRKQQR